MDTLSSKSNDSLLHDYESMERKRMNHVTENAFNNPSSIRRTPKGIAKYRRKLLWIMRERKIRIPEQRDIFYLPNPSSEIDESIFYTKESVRRIMSEKRDEQEAKKELVRLKKMLKKGFNGIPSFSLLSLLWSFALLSKKGWKNEEPIRSIQESIDSKMVPEIMIATKNCSFEEEWEYMIHLLQKREWDAFLLLVNDFKVRRRKELDHT